MVLLEQIAFEFTRPEIECGPRKRFAMPFGPNFPAKKRQNAETASQNAFKDHLLDFGLGKLKCIGLEAMCMIMIMMFMQATAKTCGVCICTCR